MKYRRTGNGEVERIIRCDKNVEQNSIIILTADIPMLLRTQLCWRTGHFCAKYSSLVFATNIRIAENTFIDASSIRLVKVVDFKKRSLRFYTVSLFLVWLNWKSNFFCKYMYVSCESFQRLRFLADLLVVTPFDYSMLLLVNAILVLTLPPREKLYIYAISNSSHDMIRIYCNVRLRWYTWGDHKSREHICFSFS